MFSLFEILIFCLFIAVSAFFSAAETAIIGISPLRVHSLAKKPSKRAASLQRLRRRPRRTIITILICNNLATVGATVYATITAQAAFGSAVLGIATGVITFLLLTFGEIAPKTLASANTERVALLAAPVVEVLGYALFPIVFFFEHLTSRLNLAAGLRTKSRLMTEEDFLACVDISVQEKVLEESESKIIRGVVEFTDKKTRQVMTPINRAVCIDSSQAAGQAFETASHKPHTNYAVFNGSRSNVVSVLPQKALLRAVAKNQDSRPVSEICVPPIFVEAGEGVPQVFKKLCDNKAKMAVVREAGKAVGVVTLSDLLGEMVGEEFEEAETAEIAETAEPAEAPVAPQPTKASVPAGEQKPAGQMPKT